jgi:hypothetical protein
MAFLDRNLSRMFDLEREEVGGTLVIFTRYDLSVQIRKCQMLEECSMNGNVEKWRVKSFRTLSTLLNISNAQYRTQDEGQCPK